MGWSAIQKRACGKLHASQPIRYSSRIKSHASAHPKRRNPSGRGVLEDRHPGHGEEFCQILSGQGSADLFDFICDRHSSLQTWRQLAPIVFFNSGLLIRRTGHPGSGFLT